MQSMENGESTPKFEVVLATYNGAQFLDKQLISILGQLDQGELLVHDDGSRDETNNIINRFADQDKRIRVLTGSPTGGASANFSYLLQNTQAPYIFCADQDDLWHPDKIKSMLSTIQFYEGVYGSDTPLLLHSDLSLITQDEQLIAHSMWEYQNIDPHWGDHFHLLLTQNVVTGCAMLVNRALLERALPVPKQATMHDHWLALVACGQGKVIWMSEPTVLYRQHTNNEVGAKKYSLSLMWSQFRALGRDPDRNIKEENKMYDTASCYTERFPGRPESIQAENFAALRQQPLLLRPFAVIQGHFFMKGWLRWLGWAIKPSHYIRNIRQGFTKLGMLSKQR